MGPPEHRARRGRGGGGRKVARRRRLKRARNLELRGAQGAQGTLQGGASRPRKGKRFRGEGSRRTRYAQLPQKLSRRPPRPLPAALPQRGSPDTPRGPARAEVRRECTASVRLPRRRPSGSGPPGKPRAERPPRSLRPRARPRPKSGGHAQWRGGGVSEAGPAVGGARVGGARRKRRWRWVGGAPAEVPARGGESGAWREAPASESWGRRARGCAAGGARPPGGRGARVSAARAPAAGGDVPLHPAVAVQPSCGDHRQAPLLAALRA